ncbi:hypothetical protein VOLCADRAFT_95773 [Volvox carteri f. nagariensis]|uniref:Uncharacterized protein n=1 Tax=Volvox carteri f. nagariensis TaxID=3068 RepID=D8U8C5_VOLCA|nr:uncharacterized protein VOLCADRAFT_95773 [Volvox carteri f. nagariensis]EFJ44113.1 hypothetical protein VOLCADRAFT_95773 [Volvox carteri f. nagariensis]|eukprot:XP_002954914.1 hypothetical protein VOLCADRAFT_95773 [Volvox carteri f. nagariensis]
MCHAGIEVGAGSPPAKPFPAPYRVAWPTLPSTLRQRRPRPHTASSFSGPAAAAAAPQCLPPPHLYRRSCQCAALSGGAGGSGAVAAPIVEPARLVSALEKLARVGQAPQQAWLDMYLAVIEPVLPQLSVGEMATLARSLGRLGVEVPEPWARALLQAVGAELLASERADDVADLLVWVAADVRLVPEAAWVGGALQQIQRLFLERPDSLSPTHAADVAWAVARMGYRPADPLLDLLALATLSMSYSYGHDRDGSSSSSSTDRGWGPMDGRGGDGERPRRGRTGKGSTTREALDPDPPGDDQDLDLGLDFGGDEAARALSNLPPEQLARLAWAFASYNYFPPDQWVQAYWLGGIWVGGLSPEGATAVLWSLGCMQLPLEGHWLQNYCLMRLNDLTCNYLPTVNGPTSQTTGRLHEVPPEGLINALWAIAACREVARAAADSATAAADVRRDEPAAGPGGSDPTPESGGAAMATATTAGQVQDEEEDEEQRRQRLLQEAGLEYAAGAELLRQQLEAFLRLRDGGAATPAQREALACLQEALDRRLAGGDGGSAAAAAATTTTAAAAAAAVDATLPAAWMTEWYEATLPYLEPPYMDRTLVVKALWAAASLELVPPPSWLRRLAAAAAALLTAGGAFEPLELLYASRSADALLARRVVMAGQRRRLQGQDPGKELKEVEEEEVKDQQQQHQQQEEEEEEARLALGRFASESFAALGRQMQLPASWRRLNPRFPPYAQPKPGAEAGPGASPGAVPGRVFPTGPVTGVAAARGVRNGGGGGGGGITVVTGAGVLRPFQ